MMHFVLAACLTFTIQDVKRVAGGLLDTAEDAATHFRRIGAVAPEADPLLPWEDTTDPRPRLLILGTGWAAHALAKVIDVEQHR